MLYNIIKRTMIAVIAGLILSGPLLWPAQAAETNVRAKQLYALRPHPQATPNATVYVEPAIVSIANNAKIEYAGGNSASFTAATTAGQSRIDLLVMNSSGALEIIQGTEAVSPAAPTYPSDKLAIAEVTVDEVSPATPSITQPDIKDVRFFLNLGGGITTATENAYVNVIGDTMTGVLNLPANGLIAGTNQLVLSGGNVGIGTTGPTEKLQVAGNITATGVISGTIVASSNISSSGGSLQISGAGPHYFSAGNVGIGTTVPEQKLHVAGNAVIGPSGADSFIKFGPDSDSKGSRIISNAGTGASYNAILIESNTKTGNPPSQANTGLASWAVDIGGVDNATFGNTLDTFNIRRRAAGAAYSAYTMPPFLVINGSGNVGIGTTTPSGKLDIQDTASNTSIFVNDTGGGNLLQLKVGGTDKFVVDNTGAIIVGQISGGWVQSFTATLGQTAFDFTNGSYTPGNNELLVFRNGILQLAGASAHYVETDLDTITFNRNMDLNEGVFVQRKGGLIAGGAAGDITGVTAGTGLTGGGASGSVTLNVDVGTTANKIVQLDANAKLPAVDASQLTNLPAGSQWTTSSANIYYNTGNVGIGTVSPGFKLDVNGIVNATALYVNGSAYIGSQWTTSSANIYYNTGNVGIGTTGPGSILALGGTAARTFGMDRNSTAATAGQGLTISSGGAIAGTADLAGGDLTLKAGISTGTGTSILHFYTAPAAVSGTADNAPTEKMTILGNGNVGIGTTAPARKFQVVNNEVTGSFMSATSNANGINIYTTTGAAQQIYTDYTGTAVDQSLILGVYAYRANQLVLATTGNVGIGTTVPGAKLDVNGNINTTGVVNALYAADIAEWMRAGIGKIEPADIIAIDPYANETVVKAVNGMRLAGVVSRKPGFLLGDKDIKTENVKVALAGRVPVKVCTEAGAIQPGEYITISSFPGIGMKASGGQQTIGIALEAFDGSSGEKIGGYRRGEIVVFVNIGYGDLSKSVTEQKEEIEKLMKANEELKKRMEKLEIKISR